MKKIFTVLMAFSIALCTMAGSTFSVAERIDLTKVSTPKMEKSFTPVEKTSKVVRVDKQEARQTMVEARQAKAVAPMAINGVRQVEAMPVAEKQALPVVNNKQRAAAQATAATDTVEIVATTWSWEYYESDNDWYTTLIDATKTYEIKLDYISDTQAGTFTEADYIMDFTGMYIYDEEGSRTIVTFTEVDIVVTDDENGLALNAELLGDNNTLYLVSALIAPLPEPVGYADLAYTNATLEDGTRSSETFQFWADENGIYTSFLIASDEVVGEYTQDDMYVAYANYIMFVDGTDTTFVDFLGFDMAITKEGQTYNLVADALGSDTIMYHITMSYTKPAPTDTIDIVATNMVVDEFEFWGQLWCTVSASNDDYTVTLDMANGLPMGELTSEDFNVEWSSVYRIADATEIVFDDILSATVTEVDGQRAIKAQALGVDTILYNLDLSYVLPTATDTVEVVFTTPASAEYYDSEGDYYIYNENEEYIVTLDIYAEKNALEGEYEGEDFYLYYTQVGLIVDGDTTGVAVAAAKATATKVSDDLVHIDAELLCENEVLYLVSTDVDVAKKGLTHDATEGSLEDEYTTEDLYTITDYSNYGFIYFDAEAADGTDLMGLQFWVDGTDENTTIPVGTYPINDSMEPGTVMASAGMTADGLTYSLYATLDEEGYIVEPCWFMVGGEVVVSEGNGILSITVDAVNSNNLPIYITCEYDLSTKQGLPYDMTEGSINRTYSDADQVKFITDYVAQYGELYLDITAADGSDKISVAFLVEATDSAIVIPAGTYPITNTAATGTVFASPGVQDGSIYPSYYGQLSATGGIVPPCYFMVGGQVVVENVNGALKVTIDALNSYDVPAHIVYEATPEPVVVTEMAGVVKRAVQNGDAVIVLTHEENGAAHIYQVVDGKAVAEVSLEGVLPVDTENPGSYLAISDIAVTEDGKLVANNYNRCSFNDGVVESGYKRGTLTFYIWEDLAAAPAIWFQSKASSNSNNSDQGYTMAVTGTSTNANILVSGVHNTQRGVRMSHFSIVDGVFEDTQDGSANLPYYYYVGSNFKGASAGADAAVFNEQTHGANIQFHASPLTPENWIIDGELTNPIEFINPQTHGGEVVINATLSEDLGKKYNGASYVTVGEKVLMVAPFANPDGQLVGAEILNITNGFDAPQYVDMVYVDEAVAATAAATAVEVVEGGLNITLVADNAIHTWFVEMSEGPVYEVYEEEITNLVIDLDNLVLMGGPGSAFQVEVYLPLGEYNMSEDSYQLTSESSIAVLGSDATFIEGYAYEVDAFTPSAKAVVRCEWNGMLLEFHLTMTAAPLEPTVVVVENAVVEIEKYLLWGDMYDYALKMSGEWINPEDGLTYPVLVEVPVYYPEATEPSEIMSTVTVGGWGDDDPWLGFGEGTLTVTTENISGGSKLITATGIVQNPMAGVAIDITISGTITPTGVEDATVTVKPVKVIKNGQLIISKDGKEYNAQGAIVK